MPETGAAVAEWWGGLGAAGTATEAGMGTAAAGESAGVIAGEGLGGNALVNGLTSTALPDATAATATAPAASEGIIPGSGPATTPIAPTEATTPTQASAQNLIDPNALQPGQYVDPGTGSVVTPGPGSPDVAAMPPQGGIIQSAMDWVNAKPVNTLITGQAIQGAAKGVFEERAAERKRRTELELQQEAESSKQRLKQGNPSVGGRGVNLGVGPSGKVLLRPDGRPVYGTGIVTGGMNGVRG